jgi:hypothetical protein
MRMIILDACVHNRGVTLHWDFAPDALFLVREMFVEAVTKLAENMQLRWWNY